MEVPDEILPDGWSNDPHTGGLVCPCGSVIELDGTCPEGHVSPVREQGFI